MLADIFFIALIIIGLIVSIPAAILLIAGIIKKARRTIIIGLFISIVPITCFGSYYWFYHINIPNIKAKNVIQFSGQYKVSQAINKETHHDKTYFMTLKTDMTFQIDSVPGMNFYGSGNWDVNGIDGQYQFFDNSGKLLDLASPFGSSGREQVVFNLYEDNEIKFVKIEPKLKE